jgi:hypothetical protein
MEGISAERALFEGISDGLVVAIPSNEAPLHGLAGTLDWRFRGQLSQFHVHNPTPNSRAGFQGNLGEFTLVPLQHRGKTYRVLLVGVGPNATPGLRTRGALAAALPSLARPLQNTLKNLGWKTPGFSSRDWGDISLSQLNTTLDGQEGLLLD